MKNLVLVVAAVVTAVSSSTFADQTSSVSFCIIKDETNQTLNAINESVIIMSMDKKLPMASKGEKIADVDGKTTYKGGYGVLVEQGIAGALESQIEVLTDASGNLVSVSISNNDKLSSAFEVNITDVKKDEAEETEVNGAGQPAQCYTGSLSAVRGLEI